MIPAIKAAIVAAAKGMIMSVLTERIIKKIVISILRDLAKKTDTRLDDDIVDDMERAVNNRPMLSLKKVPPVNKFQKQVS